MSIISNKKQTNLALISALAVSTSQTSVPDNQYLVSALSECNIQSSLTTLVVRNPYGVDVAAGVTFDPPVQDTVHTVA